MANTSQNHMNSFLSCDILFIVTQNQKKSNLNFVNMIFRSFGISSLVMILQFLSWSIKNDHDTNARNVCGTIWYQEYICQLLTSLCNESCYHSYNSRCKKCWVNTRSAFVISWHIPAPQSLGDVFPLTFGGMRLNERKCPLSSLMVMGVIFVAWVQLSYIDHLVKIGSK